jgi:hypothetical protein
MGGVKETSSRCCKFSSVEKFLQVFKFQILSSKVCEREFFKLSRVSTLKFEKVHGREFFELLKSFNIQV